MENTPVVDHAIRGTTSNGVPYVALPPERRQAARALIILWHGADPPRNEESLAGALPLRQVPAWRVYLGLPLFGQRMPEGGPEELMRRGAEDAVTRLFHPVITGAVDELPGAVDDVRDRLGIHSDLPLGIFGFSMGGSAALLALARDILPFRAAATFGAVTDIRALVDFISSMYGTTYDWTEERSDKAEQISAVDRGRAIAENGSPILFALGSEDMNPLRESTAKLAAEITRRGGTAEIMEIPGVGHEFVDEPGIEAVPQGSRAKAVEHALSEWFRRFLG